MRSALNPVMQAALAAIAPPEDPPKLAQYRELLRRHDWSHEFADELRFVNEGKASLAALRELQPQVDPDFRLWNAHCPVGCRDGAEYGVTTV